MTLCLYQASPSLSANAVQQAHWPQMTPTVLNWMLAMLQRVDRFCYLDDMLEADGRSDIIIIIITGIFKVA